MKKQKQPEILQDHNQDSERPTANWTLGKALPFIWKETCQAMFKDESMERVKLRPDNIRQITLTFQDHTLSALQRDEGQRSIMFLHGTPGNARKWDWYLRNCPKGYTMTAPDRPGFGLNTPRKNGYHIENQSELMQEWLKDISKTKEKTLLVAHSFGVLIAVKMAFEFPRLISGLVLISGSMNPKTENRHFLQKIARSTPLRYLIPCTIQNSNEELLMLPETLAKLEPVLDYLKLPVFIIHAADDSFSCFSKCPFQKKLNRKNHL